MPKQSKPQYGLVALITGLALLFGFILIKSAPDGQEIGQKMGEIGNAPSKNAAATVEIPRNEAPMDDMTRHFEKRNMTVRNSAGDRRYTYYWFGPDLEGAPADLKFPLVMVLHGTPGRSYAAKYLISAQNQIDYPAFIFVPVLAKNRRWAAALQKPLEHPDHMPDDTHGLNDAVRIISKLMKKYPIDPDRIYVTGCSDGGTGAFAAARYYPHIFAASAPIAGFWTPLDGVHMTQTPLWAIHGRHDTILPPQHAEETVKMIRSYGGPAFYTEIADMAHQCPSARLYQKPLWDWLFRQKKSD